METIQATAQVGSAQIVEETIMLLLRDALHSNRHSQSHWIDSKTSPMHR